MTSNEIVMKKLERGRAEFAYKCAEEGKKIKTKTQIDGEWFNDDKYASYVKKLPQMVLSNGLGQTLAFVVSKRKKKEKNKKNPGSEENPQNAYDLIYQQITKYMKTDIPARIKMQEDKNELVEWVISCNSTNYRYITQEILAFLNWLKRFVEGMIEEEE